MAAQSPADVWKNFCRQLELAGTDVLNWESSPMEQAEGLRYLSRLLRISLEMNLENADPAFPYFYQASHETAVSCISGNLQVWDTVSASNPVVSAERRHG